MKEIEIPEGYEAALERCKQWVAGISGLAPEASPKEVAEYIFPQLVESEDEGIRKFIIDCIEELRMANQDNADFNGVCSEAIAYLEKQKESEVRVIIPKFRVGDIVKSISQPSLSPDKIKSIGKDCYWTEHGCIGFAWEKDYELVEQKPAEWSEDDENYYDTIVRKLQVIGDDSGLTMNQIDFLDKHRPQPHWKPSEEQMDELVAAIECLETQGEDISILDSLYKDLQKLL